MVRAAASQTRGERTRRVLLDAARDRFAHDGYRATSVAVISRDAGVGSTTAFVHFANKEALFLAAVDDDVSSLLDELAARLSALAARGLVLDRLLTTVLDIVGHHPLARRLLAGLEPDFTARVLESESLGSLRDELVPVLELGQREGWVRPDLDTVDLAQGLVAIVLSTTMASVQIGPAVGDVFGPGLLAVLHGLLSGDPRST